jgi:hypothetical protein
LSRKALAADSSDSEDAPRAASVFSSESNFSEPVAADVFDFNSSEDGPMAGNVFTSSGSDSEPPVPRNTFSFDMEDGELLDGLFSSHSNEILRAADVFTSSGSDSDNVVATDASSSNSVNHRLAVENLTGALNRQLSVRNRSGNPDITSVDAAAGPPIAGPFNSKYFSTFPDTWLNAASDEGDMETDEDIVSGQE